MITRRGDLMSVRKDIRIVDATLRDGGLCNNFKFSDEFVKQLYETNVACGTDYMEFGYKASKRLFDKNKFGKWKFCDEEDLREIVGSNDTPLKIAVMADVGRCDFREDFLRASESVIDMVRVACYIHQIPAAIEMIEYFHHLGYETTCNIMAVSQAKDEQIDSALEMLGQTPVDVIYLVDSYGNMYPETALSNAIKYLYYGEKYDKSIGFHAHNNQSLAFANTIETMSHGISYLDATANGIGRGAGNCSMELLLGFLKNPKYNIYPFLKFIEDYMVPLKAQGIKWGYDIQYMLTGMMNRHPKDAIKFTEDDRQDYATFYSELADDE